MWYFIRNKHKWSGNKRQLLGLFWFFVTFGLMYLHTEFTDSLTKCEKLPVTIIIDLADSTAMPFTMDGGRCHFQGVGEQDRQWSVWVYHLQNGFQRIWLK